MAKKETNTLQDLRSKDVIGLGKDVATSSKKLNTLRAELAVGKLTNHASINKLRKDIARMKTLITEKNILKEIEG
jgi:large subunit ribosomal protein L29